MIYDIGTYSFLPSCENAQITAESILDADGLFYRYRLGLKPKSVGDYIISGLEGKIKNVERNLSIAENYSIQRHPDQNRVFKM